MPGEAIRRGLFMLALTLILTGTSPGSGSALEAELARLERDGLAALLPDVRERSVLLGRRVEIAAGADRFRGTAARIADDGALVVALADGTERRVLAGEATLAPAGGD
jgi:biotin-(acetyl-CoA carboxylase) ligase